MRRMDEDVWLPLVDEPLGAVIDRIQAEDTQITSLLGSPRRQLAFRTFAYLRVGILLGRLLVERDVDPQAAGTWVDQLLEEPARVLSATVVALTVLALGASTASAAAPADSSSRALGVQVALPGGGGETAVSVSSPPERSTTAAAYSYGESVSTGSLGASSPAGGSVSRASAGGSASVQAVSLFGGEITADAVFVKATAQARGAGAEGSLGASSLSNLTVLGAPVAATPNARVELGDWGYAIVLEQAVVRQTKGRFGYRGFVTGLHVVLTADHGGLPAGSEIRIRYAEAAASAPKPPPPPSPPPPPPAADEPAPEPAPAPPPPKQQSQP